jgi:hypothetical protein
MAYFCAECSSPIASSTAHCYSCGADHVPGVAETFLPYAAILVGLVLGIGGTFLGLHYWRTMDSGGSSITTTTPDFSSDSRLGVKVYPGASPASPDSQDHVLRIKKGNTDSVRADYVTYDAVDKVLKYYQDAMGSDAVTKRASGSTIVTLARDSGVGTDTVVVTLTSFTESHPAISKTRITIARKKIAAA